MHKKKTSSGFIRGKIVKGEANAYRCFSKKIAEVIIAEQKKLIVNLLHASPEFAFNFLAGVIDGDGAYNSKGNRINIFCSKDYLLKAISVACLRLNIAYSITTNRTIYNIQIVDKIEDIFRYTRRVKGKYDRMKFGVRLFAARQLLEDIIQKVNYKGRIKSYISNNLLIDAEKIRNFLIPMIKGELQNHELTTIINSDLKMLRADKERDLPQQKVYNITVSDNHNYAVFTNKLTPVVVNNCHAAIVSRELGIPAVVGTKNSTSVIKPDSEITVDCSQGETGYVYKGALPYEVKKTNLKNIPRPKVKIMMNLADPDEAFKFSFLPNDGIGLAREEFIINNYIKIHTLALINYQSKRKTQNAKRKSFGSKKNIKFDRNTVRQIEELTAGYDDKIQFYVDKIAEGIGKLAAAYYPKDVIVRFSDFKTNEYANLIGGKYFEPK